ncbi:TetR/AcrR family transcriptional regulator [Streptomyces sp. AJS327]|nr:TetR/AcrR family transcriptional regulator [Streptomyces sp. AJS327]
MGGDAPRGQPHTGTPRVGAPSRRRGPELEGAILDAAWNVLVERGYPGFTYEAVATRARTSRPVLYRRWPHRDDLLLATLAEKWQPIPVPDTGTLREDAVGFLRAANALRAHMTTLISVQLMDHFRDSGTSFSELRDALRAPGQATAFEQIVARAVARGELPDAPRSARVVNMPLDLLRHDMLMTAHAVPDASVVEIVDEMWLPLLRSTDADHPA